MKRYIIVCVSIICIACIGLTTWYVYRLYLRSEVHVTVQPHALLSDTAHTCIRQALPYILYTTRQPHTIASCIQAALPHVRHVAIRWKTPYHAHCSVYVDPPCLLACTRNTQYAITKSGMCVPACYIAPAVRTEIPQLTWNAPHKPEDVASYIHEMYRNIPRTWWDQYNVVWHNTYDIRLHAIDTNSPDVRTSAHRCITPRVCNNLAWIHTGSSRSQRPWIDIRFPRYAIVYNNIGGVNNGTKNTSRRNHRRN